MASVVPGAVPVTRLEIDVTNLRSDKGTLRVCLTAERDNFPRCADRSRAMTLSVPATSRIIRFDAVPPGDYALAVIHDENDNKRLDKLAGMPREGFGFSRNPRIWFGPPAFASARFTVSGAEHQEQVKIRYML